MAARHRQKQKAQEQAGGEMAVEGTEADAGGWESPAKREWYLRSFTQAASKGLYSYDTPMLDRRDAKYYLVAAPARPLGISDLPAEAQRLLEITKAPLVFAESPYISEASTLDW